MKKILIYILVLICVVFIIPSAVTKKRRAAVENKDSKDGKDTEIIEENAENPRYEYSKFAKIKLLHTKTGNIEEFPIDEYICSVVSGEMPVSYSMEALKAQAIVARTYTLYQIINSHNKHKDADICDNYACCQAWLSREDRLSKWDANVAEQNWNKIEEAVYSTQGKIITYEGEPIDAFFHSNSGGITETAVNVWGGSDLPYLKSVETAGEDEYSGYSSEVKLSKEELFSKVKEKYPEFEIDWNLEDSIKILEYTESKRVKTLKIGNIQIAGTEARSIFGLKSTNFSVNIENDIIKFQVLGYGHGVGMSQTGAEAMSKMRK